MLTTLVVGALLIPSLANGASAGAPSPITWDPGPELTMDDICALGLCSTPPLLIDVDVMPGNQYNCFRNDGHGVIPVALFGSAALDVGLVDLHTVAMSSMHVQVVGKGQTLASFQDLNGDGFTDVLVQVQDVDGAFSAGVAWATVSAKLVNGQAIVGVDAVCVFE